jgi:hypothetical protein
VQKSMVSYGQYSVHIEATATGQGQQAIGKLGLRAILVGILQNGVNVSIVSGCSIRLSSKAAASEEARRYKLHFVRAVRPDNGSWRTEKPLQRFRPPKNSFSTLNC